MTHLANRPHGANHFDFPVQPKRPYLDRREFISTAAEVSAGIAAGLSLVEFSDASETRPVDQFQIF
jgi:hypothetical protein